MKPAYSITYGNTPPVIKRGKLEPIQLALVQKMGNKKVTLVDNLHYYGIPASDVAQSLQKMAAASTTGMYSSCIHTYIRVRRSIPFCPRKEREGELSVLDRIYFCISFEVYKKNIPVQRHY